MIFDICIAIVVTIFAIKYYNQGLVRSVFMLVSKFIILGISFFVAKINASKIYEQYIQEKVYGYVDSIIVKAFDFEEIFNSLQNSLDNANATAVSKLLQAHEMSIENIVDIGAEKATLIIRESLVNSVAYGFTYAIIFIIMLIVTSLAFNFIFSIVDFVLELPIIEQVNKLSGAVIGVITGFLVCNMVIWTIILLMPVITMEGGMLHEDALEHTYIIKHVCSSTPDFIINYIY